MAQQFRQGRDYLDMSAPSLVADHLPFIPGFSSRRSERAGAAAYLQELAGQNANPDLKNPAAASAERVGTGVLGGAAAGALADTALNSKSDVVTKLIAAAIGGVTGGAGGAAYDMVKTPYDIRQGVQDFDEARRAGRLQFKRPENQTGIIFSGAADQGAMSVADAVGRGESSAGDLSPRHLYYPISELITRSTGPIGMATAAGESAYLSHDAKRRKSKMKTANLCDISAAALAQDKQAATASSKRWINDTRQFMDEFLRENPHLKRQRKPFDFATEPLVSGRGSNAARVIGAGAVAGTGLHLAAGNASAQQAANQAGQQGQLLDWQRKNLFTGNDTLRVNTQQKFDPSTLHPATGQRLSDTTAGQGLGNTEQLWNKYKGYAPYAIAGGIGLSGLAALSMMSRRRRRDED